MSPYRKPCPLCKDLIYGSQKSVKCSTDCSFKFHIDCLKANNMDILTNNGQDNFVCPAHLQICESLQVSNKSVKNSNIEITTCGKCLTEINADELKIVCGKKCNRYFHLKCMELEEIDLNLLIDQDYNNFICVDCQSFTQEENISCYETIANESVVSRHENNHVCNSCCSKLQVQIESLLTNITNLAKKIDILTSENQTLKTIILTNNTNFKVKNNIISKEIVMKNDKSFASSPPMNEDKVSQSFTTEPLKNEEIKKTKNRKDLPLANELNKQTIVNKLETNKLIAENLSYQQSDFGKRNMIANNGVKKWSEVLSDGLTIENKNLKTDYIKNTQVINSSQYLKKDIDSEGFELVTNKKRNVKYNTFNKNAIIGSLTDTKLKAVPIKQKYKRFFLTRLNPEVTSKDVIFFI